MSEPNERPNQLSLTAVNMQATCFALGEKIRSSSFKDYCLRLLLPAHFQGSFSGRWRFPSLQEQRGTSVSWCTHQKFCAELLKSCGPVSGNTQGWQVGYLQIRERNLCSLSTLEWKVCDSRFLSRGFLPVTGSSSKQDLMAMPPVLIFGKWSCRVKLETEFP